MKTLWTTLFAHFSEGKKPMLLRSGVKRWFKRAKPRQLTFVLKVSMPSKGVGSEIRDEFNALLFYIARKASRFHVISVADDRVHPGMMLTPPVQSPALWGERIMQVVSDNSRRFTNLISFNYCRTYYLHQHPLLTTMDPPFQLPQSVRKLVLNPGPIEHPRSISPIPTLRNVVHLDLQGYSLTPSEFLQQLAFCPRIVTGLFTIYGHNINDLDSTPTPVRLEEIRHLTLFPIMHGTNLDFLGTHIGGLKQTLTELSIDGLYMPSPILYSTALTPHRGEGLTDLTLMNLEVVPHDLVSFITGCQALQSLYIRLPSVRETEIVGMLHRSTYEPDSLDVLPALKKFSIDIFMDLHAYIPDLFEGMVRSRRNESLLRDSSRLIEVVNLLHIGVGDKPEIDQLRESLVGLSGFELNIEGPKEH
ncbi:hypothetical protein M413DRAFT_446126 [Hebeloma cylindrosporum]|uniref:Uncharacterized protein n=1 Tax=Hebeloma cylindrosporum TaxID=76867 RepID=A0A0C3C940_HEBCY|nr:hypothetical protein M413DRAFT_446126 [Hebeloma cylindrosporum h7]